jgi:tetratricopeptide (TPR) repeat protein
VLNLAVLEFQQGRYEAGIELLERCLRIQPAQPIAHYSIGRALQLQQRPEQALARYEQAIAQARLRRGLNNRGLLLQGLGRPTRPWPATSGRWPPSPVCGGAEQPRQPARGPGPARRGAGLLCRALALQAITPSCTRTRPTCWPPCKREAALQAYDQAIALKPDFAAAYVNRACCCSRAARGGPGRSGARPATAARLGPGPGQPRQCAQGAEPPDEALASYRQAQALQPDTPWLPGLLVHAQMHLCDWRGLDEGVHSCAPAWRAASRWPIPSPCWRPSTSPRCNCRRRACRPGQGPGAGRRTGTLAAGAGGKIRIGYYSADFHNHATMHLMAELFERHDRTRFELHAFSFGPSCRMPGASAVAAFDHFHDVRQASDADIVALSRQLQIDIAIDLKGHTVDARPGLFAPRRAGAAQLPGLPRQPGRRYIDYIVADPVLIPAGQPGALPGAGDLPAAQLPAQPGAAWWPTSPPAGAAGLPEQGFVFCSFNNNYKITPAVFDGWVRILQATPGSLLAVHQRRAGRREPAPRGRGARPGPGPPGVRAPPAQ